MLQRLVTNIEERNSNKSSRFKWSFQLLVLLIAVLAKDQLMLLFERAIDIDADIIAQNKLFEEVFIWGELSSSDLARARDLVSTFTVRTVLFFYVSYTQMSPL